MIKILFIHPQTWDPTQESYRMRFILLSKHNNGDIITKSLKRFAGLKLGNFNFHPMDILKKKRNLYIFYKVVKLAVKLNKKEPFDIIHCYDPLRSGIAGSLIKFLTGAKLIIEVNGHLLDSVILKEKGCRFYLKKLIFPICIRFSLKTADLIKCINHKLVEEYKDSIRQKKVLVFHDFVDTTSFYPKAGKDCNYIFFAGYPFHIKGVDILIKAFNLISKEFPKIKLLIMGHHSTIKSHPLDISRYVMMINDNDNIKILKPVFFNDIINFFQNCTFFVLPSRSEAMGRVLIEAMACGKAVIGSSVGGISEVIEDGQNGFLFESENYKELADKMRILLTNKEIRAQMGQRSLEIVEKRFSSNKYIKSFNEMINKTQI